MDDLELLFNVTAVKSHGLSSEIGDLDQLFKVTDVTMQTLFPEDIFNNACWDCEIAYPA